jgi:GTP-binding protein
MKILTAKYIGSIAGPGEKKTLDKLEVCFIGRSNVGKSSMINKLVMQKIARTSSTPGATRMINLFEVFYETDGVRERLIFSDFPGFGYAKASKKVSQGWQEMIENYIVASKSTKRLIWVYDVRREIDEMDKALIDWLHSLNLDFTLVLTKIDKVNSGEALTKKRSFEKLFGEKRVFGFSSKDGYGRTELLSHIICPESQRGS